MSLALDNLAADGAVLHLVRDDLLLGEHALVGAIGYCDILNMLLLNSAALSREEFLLIQIPGIHFSRLGRGAFRLGKLMIGRILVGLHLLGRAVVRDPDVVGGHFLLFHLALLLDHHGLGCLRLQ